MKQIFVVVLLLTRIGMANAQTELFKSKVIYNHQDSLRGSITPAREWWNLLHYDLYVTVNPVQQFITGKNIIRYRVLENRQNIQIDLQPPMTINHALQDGVELEVMHDGNAHFIKLKANQEVSAVKELEIQFSGKPVVAKNAPWDGGFSWAKDSYGNPFIATSCQGIGASLWWPCKDHMYDEPDNGAQISINVPGKLVAVSNGRLTKVTKEKNKTKTYVWQVVNPINNYGIKVNIGDYVNFSEQYDGEKGKLDLDYWVLKSNLEKAKVHFADAKRTIKAFEHWFGPYPFYEDSYKLVEVPYLGMEHQSSVTYGNGYRNGYRGTDLSGTGWGLKWDYIIVHESGHEWFANNITYKDVADMWVHEGFTMYSESLFIEYFYGKEAGSEYTRGLRMNIQNDAPIIGDYEVNAEGSKDMYNKGSNLLHTLRQIVRDDEKWRATLRGLNTEFYHQVVTSQQVEDYMAKSLALNLKPFFDQYLRDIRIPTFEYAVKDKSLLYRWTNCIESFNMPVKILIDGKEVWLKPLSSVKRIDLETALPEIKIDPNFYVYISNTTIKQ